ncbi:helix-turn-helix transcriptional regulator [Enterobacteriaceae bacterium LUAb1]
MEARRIVIYLQDENQFYIGGLMLFLKQFFDQMGISTSFTQYFSDKRINLSFVSQQHLQILDKHVNLPTSLLHHPLFVLCDSNIPCKLRLGINRRLLSRHITLETLQKELNAQFQCVCVNPTSHPPSLLINNNMEKLDRLTLREKETLRYLARGMNNVAIARCLKISEKTVSSHKRNIMTKLSIGRGPDFNYWLLKQRYFH